MSTWDRDNEDWPNSQSLAFIESLYSDFVQDPTSVSNDWRAYFSRMNQGGTRITEARVGPSFKPTSIFNPPSAPHKYTNGATGTASATQLENFALKQDRVNQLIREYRIRGHLVARIDPLGLPRPPQPELEPSYFGFTEKDLDKQFSTETFTGPNRMTLRKIIDRLNEIYCQAVGSQYMHIDDLKIRSWISDRVESVEKRLKLSRREQIRIYTRLANAVLFEEFIQKKWKGAKSFSLEGAESLIPLLDLLIEQAAESGVTEVVLGMAHRGRLNVLANIMQKGYAEIFKEFEDFEPEYYRGRGDVKYHLGYSSDWKTGGGKNVHLSLCFNPSHLEFVNPVLMGRTRAKQDRDNDTNRMRHLAVQIHGDAAFAGEGVVQEVLNLSELPGYNVGGSIHIIVNNQIGFTTMPRQGMSTVYNTDIAKMLQVPIFHVNGENPEAVAQVVKLAMDFRTTFKKDVVIDMYCYRRRGHNESDEPKFTQPLMYKRIESNMKVHEAYLENLVMSGGITVQEAEALIEPLRQQMEQAFTVARAHEPRNRAGQQYEGIWKGFEGGKLDPSQKVDTALTPEIFKDTLTKLTTVPDNFAPHSVIERLLKNRREMAEGNRQLDWAAAEALAFGSLLRQGHRVRLTGQDVERGTFSHRHAVLHDQESGEIFTPLEHLDESQGPLEIINSPLSEIAVLGFEYGYSLDTPRGLVAWEAQFGDFCNVAQVVIDQFIISAEEKWNRLCGLVLLLPHGFEGAGPEHSSARLERFLNLAAEDNIQVVNLTTPAQYFHALRRQVISSKRKPLVVMTPKSLLRLPEAVSAREEFLSSTFQPVLPETEAIDPDGVKRILICSGKIYYELAAERKKLGRDDVAIIRLEELYPLPIKPLEQVLSVYKPETPAVWVQEEPQNMGAWWHLAMRLGPRLLDRHPWRCISRDESASPATGSHNSHKIEQQQILTEAFAGL